MIVAQAIRANPGYHRGGHVASQDGSRSTDILREEKAGIGHQNVGCTVPDLSDEVSVHTGEEERDPTVADVPGRLRSDELALLLKITNNFNAGWELSEILDTMYDEFQRLLPYDRMEYAVLEEGGHVLVAEWVRAGYGRSAVPTGSSYRRSDPIRDDARYQVPFLDNDLPTGAVDRPPDHPVSMLAAEGIKASLNCPLVVGGEIRGYLFFNSRQTDAYSSHHLDLIQLIAGQLASLLEQTRLNEQLRARNQELRDLERSRLEFIATISHELRTPLTAVVGFSEELRDSVAEFSADDISQFASVIAAQSSEVSGIVEDLLVMSRAESGHLSVTPTPVNVAAEVRRVGEFVTAERPDQVTKYRLVDAIALADPMRVRQITRNLLSNAGRYGGPTVRVTLRIESGYVVLVVCDDGPGIPAADQEAIFQAYGRSEAAARRPGSIGLGLTVSRYLAEAMGGSLEYRRAECGSHFELRLPAYLTGGRQ
jgi:signal transduction histidine kinase